MTTNDTRAAKTRVRASTLRGALRDVGGIVEARNTIPILSNVLLQVRNQRITVTATDLDHWAVRTCATDDRDGPASKEWLDSIRPFTVCLPAKPLEAVLGKVDGDAMVTIEAPCEIGAAWSGPIAVSAGRARWKLPALPAKEFPDIAGFEVASEFEMACGQLADVLAGVDHAISTEETRYYLNGVYLHPVDLNLLFAATDGHRLARWSMDGPVGSTSFPPAIVSRKTVAVLGKLLMAAVKADKANDGAAAAVQIEANADGSRLRLVMPTEGDGEVEVLAKAIDGTFPDYVRVIPSAPEYRLIVERAALAAAVERVAVLAETKSRAVKLSLEADLVTISTRSPELGEASEELACTFSGPPFEIGFDSKFLREGLGAVASDTVALQLAAADGAAPARISGWEDGGEVGPLLQVLMPVRV